jgi:hypothetical protein
LGKKGSPLAITFRQIIVVHSKNLRKHEYSVGKSRVPNIDETECEIVDFNYLSYGTDQKDLL